MKLLTVDLEAGLRAIPPPGVGEQWVLVRFHREPLGILKFHSRGCSVAELARLVAERFELRLVRHLVADWLAAPDAAPEAAGDLLSLRDGTCPRLPAVSLPPLSAAVCTRDGAERLPECLDAFNALNYPGLLDLMVIDNAPADDRTRRVVEERYPAIRYIVEPRPGLDWARNRAVLEARGNIIAFTDDDVSVDPWWAEAIGRIFAADPDVAAVTGLVVADEMDVDAQRLFESYGGFGRGFTREYFRVDTASGEDAATRHGGSGRFGTGANMAFRRAIFDRIGLFDPALDVGTPTNGGGDLEMFFRVLKEGGTLVYEPSAMVRHRHRRSYGQLRTQLANNGVGFYSYLVRSASAYPGEQRAFVRLGAWWLWWWSGRRLARSFVRSDFPRDLVVAELRGSFTGLRRYAPASRQAAAIAASFGPQHPYASIADGEPLCSAPATGR